MIFFMSSPPDSVGGKCRAKETPAEIKAAARPPEVADLESSSTLLSNVFQEDGMLKPLVSVCVSALIVGGTAVLAAPEQNTLQAGQPTQARVWVENRGRAEAVPVDLREANLDGPLRVRIVAGEQTPADAIMVRVVPPRWEYRSITMTPDQNAAQVLNAEGTAGWETTGIVLSSADGNVLLLKRPR
jgi:hypothetical protein